MLFEFIATNRELIITRARERVASRPVPRATDIEIVDGVPLFLNQLVSKLQTGDEAASSGIGETASRHGAELLQSGFTIAQVVHDYGNICQVITALANELDAPISPAEYRLFNHCLDVAIAEAVTEYSRQRVEDVRDRGAEHLGYLAHELRNHLATASLAYEAVVAGTVPIGGGTTALIGKSLDAMRILVDESLSEVRLQAGLPRNDRILVASLLEDIEIAASMHARDRDISITIGYVDRTLAVDGDFQIVASILSNLVQNACKYTRTHGHVSLTTRVSPDRVLIDVSDECGGLAPGKAEELFRPFEQRDTDRTGLGLGLALSLKGARAIGGKLEVHNVPGTGCVFTVDLHRSASITPVASPR